MSDNLFSSDDAGVLAKATSLEKQQRDAARMLDFACGVRQERGRQDVKVAVPTQLQASAAPQRAEVTRLKGPRRIPQALRLNNVDSRRLRVKPYGRVEHEVHPFPMSRAPRADGDLRRWLEPKEDKGAVQKPFHQIRAFRNFK